MKIVFPNSATMPTIELLISQGGRLRQIPFQVRFGLILHPIMEPTLIDTGYTIETVQCPKSRALRVYSKFLQPILRDAGQPVEVLNRFDLTHADIQLVIITHCHAGHISGLRQFVNALFIAAGKAVQAILKNNAFGNYRHGVFPELLPDDFDPRIVDLHRATIFPSAPCLPAGCDVLSDGSVIAFPLSGHMNSHFGIFFHKLSAHFCMRRTRNGCIKRSWKIDLPANLPAL